MGWFWDWGGKCFAKWVSSFGSYSDLDASVSDILARLVFGLKADKFEGALDEPSRALRFAGERPDKEWKEGPDNLWALDDTQYHLWECKNEVEITRAEINKREAEQMNRSSVWFEKHYQGMNVKRIIVHASNSVQSATAFTHEVEAELKKLVKLAAEFFKLFESLHFQGPVGTAYPENDQRS
jgi:replicative superfamily II helicase